MKITTPTINDVPDTFAKNFGAAVEKDSGGRIKAEVYPASQLGSIPRQIEGTQFGAIQCAVIPPEFWVGLDERFEVMAAPGLVDSLAHGQKRRRRSGGAQTDAGLGADKGLHGVGLFMAEPSAVVARDAIRHLADFKGKKMRIFASQFQTEAFDRLGATPVAMTLGDVLPALQQGAIDGAVAGMGPFTNMHFIDAAKYVTMTNQPSIFLIAEVNKKWYDSLPAGFAADRRQGRRGGVDCHQPRWRSICAQKAEANWVAARRRIDQSAARRTSRDDENAFERRRGRVATKPQLAAAYKIVSDAASERGPECRMAAGAVVAWPSGILIVARSSIN